MRDEIRMTIAAYQTLYESRWVQTFKAFIPYGGQVEQNANKQTILSVFLSLFLILRSWFYAKALQHQQI